MASATDEIAYVSRVSSQGLRLGHARRKIRGCVRNFWVNSLRFKVTEQFCFQPAVFALYTHRPLRGLGKHGLLTNGAIVLVFLSGILFKRS